MLVKSTLSKYDGIKSKVFRRYRLSREYTLKQLAGTKDKCDAYITLRAIDIIKRDYPALEITDYIFHQSPDKDMVYSSIMTKPNVNHPFIVFAHIQNSILYLINPAGKDKKFAHNSLDDFVYLLNAENRHKLDTPFFYALYLSFGESIRIRKKQILYSDKYGLLECSNIKLCQRRMKTLKKETKYKSKATITNEIKTLETFYQNKSVNFLLKYFNLLEKGEFNEAYMFLKGGGGGEGKINSGKYYKKERLNTFFAKTKKIIGHLEIFISLYEILFKCIERYEEVKTKK